MTNKWLTSTVKTYIDTFGICANPIVYDVGSRDGHDGVELASRIRDDGRVWLSPGVVLFECNPPQQEYIKKSYPEATLITEAISNKKGTSSFLQIDGDKNYIGSSSMDLNRKNYSWVRKTNTIEVPTRRLDSVIKELGHENVEIDIMKIDIEGYTWEALEGLGKYLRNVRVFHLETETAETARNKNNLEIFECMESKGYKCAALEYEWPPHIQDQVWVRQDV